MRHRRSKSANGFTLLELLLTMAVVAAVTAVALPHFGLLLGDRRLVRGGEQVRIEMNRVRVEAMRQGRVMMIDARSGSGELRVKAFYSIADSTEAIDQTGSQSALLTGAEQGNMASLTTNNRERRIELPAGVSVESIGVVSAARGNQIEQSMLAEQSDGWSRPILFFPDGSTSTAAVRLAMESAGHITIRLRGVTGQASVDQVTP